MLLGYILLKFKSKYKWINLNNLLRSIIYIYLHKSKVRRRQKGQFFNGKLFRLKKIVFLEEIVKVLFSACLIYKLKHNIYTTMLVDFFIINKSLNSGHEYLEKLDVNNLIYNNYILQNKNEFVFFFDFFGLLLWYKKINDIYILSFIRKIQIYILHLSCKWSLNFYTSLICDLDSS